MTLRFLLLALTLLLPFSRGTAALYVDHIRGDDKNNGLSEETAVRTIQCGVDRAEPGTTIWVYPGTYDENIVLKSGQPEKPIRLQARFPGMARIGKPLELKPEDGSTPPVVRAQTGNARVLGVVDLRSGWMRRMASPAEVEKLAGSFFDARKEGIVTIHLSGYPDLANVTLLGITNPGSGVRMADHTILDGLTITGFASAGVLIDKASDVEIRNCVFYANACGIAAMGGSDIRILDNRLWRNGWENNPLWWNGRPSGYAGQIIFNPIRGIMEHLRVENNLAAWSNGHGIRFYAGRGVKDSVVRGNVVYGSEQMGLFYKTGIHGDATAENNIAFRNTAADLRAPIAVGNIVGRLANYPGNPDGWKIEKKENVNLKGGDARALFLAPRYDDFRIAPRTPLSKTPAAEAFNRQKGGEIRFVPGSEAGTIRTGETVCVTSGNAESPLLLEELKAEPGRPTVLRGQPGKEARFKGAIIRNCENLVLQNLGFGPEGVVIENSGNVTLDEVSVTEAAQTAITLRGSHGVHLHRSEITGAATGGLEMDEASTLLRISGSRFRDNSGAHLIVQGETPSLAVAGGSFSGPAPFLRQGEQTFPSPVDVKQPGIWVTDFALLNGERDFGPLPPGTANGFIDQVNVVSTTPTTANLTFRTPGLIVGALVEWGEGTHYGHRIDHADFKEGDYETFHTLSLIDLKPGKTYHFRVGFRDPWKETVPNQGGLPVRDDPDLKRIIWSEDFTFTTATEPLPPRKLYVALNGDDTNPGDRPEAPWRTLAKAAREARAGDVVTLAPGRYTELLAPLQSGESPERPIVFRAERPLTVWIDGGAGKESPGGTPGEPSGRSYCVTVHGKAFIEFENLSFYGSALRQNRTRGLGDAYAAQVDISGSHAIGFSGCVFDGRGGYSVGMAIRGGGDLRPPETEGPAVLIRDSLFFHSFYIVTIQSPRGDVVFEQSALVNGQIYGIVMDYAKDDSGRLVFRRNVIAPMAASLRKLKHPFLFQQGNVPMPVDSDENCFVWDDADTARGITNEMPLAKWREQTGQDLHSEEKIPDWPLWEVAGLNQFSAVNRSRIVQGRPLTIADLVSRTPDGPKAGPRWARYLSQP